MLDFLSNLNDPQTYECRVWDYKSAHSRLIIRVNKINQFVTDDEAFVLLFLGVRYFEGPLQWIGVNFLEGSNDECLKLLHRTTLSKDHIAKSAGLDIFSLFTLELDNFTIKIVAESIDRIALDPSLQ